MVNAKKIEIAVDSGKESSIAYLCRHILGLHEGRKMERESHSMRRKIGKYYHRDAEIHGICPNCWKPHGYLWIQVFSATIRMEWERMWDPAMVVNPS